MVRREIAERLGLREPVVIAGGFDRPNLRLEVQWHPTDTDKRDAVMSAVTDLAGPVLLYTATRKDAETYADELARRGRQAAAYHAGLRVRQRDEVHHRFHDGEIDVVAATSAFGMGVDKPDVRAVVHAAVPDSLDSYYQQIGRGGRDGDAALALLFYRAEDLSLGRFFSTQRPDEDLIRAVYAALCDGRPKRLKSLRSELGVRGRKLTNAVNLLEQARVIASGPKGFAVIAESGVDETQQRSTPLDRALAVAASSERIDRSRVEMMRGYAETRGCRRQNLLAYFGQNLARPCGNCDRCSETAEASVAGPPPLPINTTVEHQEWGPGVVMSGDSDRVTVLFERYGYRTLSMDVVRQSGVLRRS